MPYRCHLSEDELPEDQIEFIEINARLSEVYENITEAKEPLPDAKKFETVINKRSLIDL
jgi:ferredoxin